MNAVYSAEDVVSAVRARDQKKRMDPFTRKIEEQVWMDQVFGVV